MAGIFDSLVKGLSELAPQDDPSLKAYNAKNELSELDGKEAELFAALGKRVYEEDGLEKYPDLAVQYEALEANRAAVRERIRVAEEEKLAKEKASAAEEQEKNQQHCPDCDACNPSGAKFCCACGRKLDTIPHCVSCGGELSPGARFCGICGTKQGE